MTRTRTLALALALLVAASEPAAASWASVRAIPPGTRVTVRLLDREVPRGERLIKGKLESATADSVTLRTKDSILRSIPKPAVRKVRAYRPPFKRNIAWIVAGSVGVFMLGAFPHMTPGSADPWDREHRGIMLMLAAAVTVPVSFLAFRLTRMKTVYRAN